MKSIMKFQIEVDGVSHGTWDTIGQAAGRAVFASLKRPGSVVLIRDLDTDELVSAYLDGEPAEIRHRREDRP